MKYQFVTLNKETPPSPQRETFLEAWNDMYQYVSQQLNVENLTLQELETALWIETEIGPIFFYNARNRAIDDGWKVEQSTPMPPPVGLN